MQTAYCRSNRSPQRRGEIEGTGKGELYKNNSEKFAELIEIISPQILTSLTNIKQKKLKKTIPKHIIIKLLKIRAEDKIFTQRKKTCYV